jgi:cell wall-associated NlpC family hydrolase
MREKSFDRTILKITFIACFSVLVVLRGPAAQADTKTETDKIAAMLDKECVNLKKDKLKELLLPRFSMDIDQGLSPDFLKIMEGVVKRTDFDNISEEKTAEIIGLVYASFKKGASLEYLDQLFDVAYAKTIGVDSMTAAAKALQEFHHSDVPPDIAEEFVYRSLEDVWDPAAVPVLTRGLIYGVDRGLTPQRIALIIMLDMQQGALKEKNADQLVLDAIRLVRNKEPKNWKPMKQAEKEVAEKQEQKRKLESLQRQAEENRRQKEIEKKKSEEALQRMHSGEENKVQRDEQEQVGRQIEAMLKTYQAEIVQYQNEQRQLDAGLASSRQEMDHEKQRMDREREESRQKQLETMEQSITASAKSGRLDVARLYASVDRHIGIPYRYGGDSEAGIDCSAFTRRVYRSQNVELPRSSMEQSFVGFGIGGEIMRPGDLVFFDPSIVGRISHVGVYLGNGVFAHASSSKGVTKSSIREKYYTKRFVKAKRVFDM